MNAIGFCRFPWVIIVWFTARSFVFGVMKSRRLSSISLEIMTFRKSLLYFLILALLSFFRRQKIFLCPALLVLTGHNHAISWPRPRKPSQKLSMCNFVASSEAFVAKAGIAWEHWWSYIGKHRAPLRDLLTHVWIPGLRVSQ